MIITTAKYTEEIYVNGRHAWVGFDATLSEGEDEIACALKLQESAQKFCQAAEKSGKPKIPHKVPDEIQRVLTEIESCTSIPKEEGGLETLWTICKSNLVLTEAYNKKLNELQNK